MKLTPENREKIRKDAQADRNKFENMHLGGFEQIYPVQDQDRMAVYSQLKAFADESYQILTGGKKQTNQISYSRMK